jgi:hypothetical protein
LSDWKNVRVVVYTTIVENDDRCKVSSDDYVVAYISLNEAIKGETYIYETYVAPNSTRITVESYNDDYDYIEYITSWSLLFDGELTWNEEAQLEQEGLIQYPTKSIGNNWAGPWLPIDCMKFFNEQRKH